MSLPEDKVSLLGFSVFPGIGPVRIRLLESFFGSLYKAWNSTYKELIEVGLPQTLVRSFILFREKFDVQEYIKSLNTKHIRWLCYLDDEYPKRLKEITDAPLVLFILGNADISLLSEEKLIAVVGTRNMSNYGLRATDTLTRDLVESGYGIVSGLALGVDGQAHKTTLRCGGKTIAVLGCGVDIIAPASHSYIYNQIIKEGGLIVSEMPLGCRPSKGVFPARNRIISGLSRGVLVIEGAVTSGSLITAKYALEQGREVFAVSGSIYNEGSAGPHSLIKNGAYLVESYTDIVDILEPGITHKSNSRFIADVSDDEKIVLEVIRKEDCDVDHLISILPLSSNDIHKIVLNLELQSIIERDDLGIYRLTQRY